MDRNIPHIRDIFSSSRKKSGEFQDLCIYDKSPRSRRKAKGFEPIQQENDQQQQQQQQICQRKRSDKGKENNHKSKNSDEAKLIQDVKNNTAHNKNHQYCSKTLTERDIRHLERHLSMKKTIRKQISRNLAQAFIDNPNLFEPDQPKPDYGVTQTSRNKKLPKQEQNVLDILKTSIDDRDSGHSSPTTEVLSREDDDYDNYNDNYDDGKGWNGGHRNSEAKLIHEDERSPAISTNKSHSGEKRSIWKMFSTKNKTKR